MTPLRLLDGPSVSRLAQWLEGDGGLGYAHAVELEPDAVRDLVLASGLRGRGDAGFPTGRKWAGVVEHATSVEAPTFLVCNGAEGEPGTTRRARRTRPW